MPSTKRIISISALIVFLCSGCFFCKFGETGALVSQHDYIFKLVIIPCLFLTLICLIDHVTDSMFEPSSAVTILHLVYLASVTLEILARGYYEVYTMISWRQTSSERFTSPAPSKTLTHQIIFSALNPKHSLIKSSSALNSLQNLLYPRFQTK